MNGRYLLDTNAVIALLNGNTSIAKILLSATWVGISVITELEFLSFTGLSSPDRVLFQKFKTRVEVVGLDPSDAGLLQQIVAIRVANRVKMPDAIILATATNCQATLLTQDTELLKVDTIVSQGF